MAAALSTPRVTTDQALLPNVGKRSVAGTRRRLIKLIGPHTLFSAVMTLKPTSPGTLQWDRVLIIKDKQPIKKETRDTNWLKTSLTLEKKKSMALNY